MILILMASRTGSSMVARIFADHGFDTGPVNKMQCGSYLTYEFQAVKDWIYERKGAMKYRPGQFVEPVQGIEEILPDNACVKIGVEYWPLFKHLNPRVVTVKRDPDAAARSYCAKFAGDYCLVLANVLRRFELMDIARAEAGGCEVSTDAIIAGDLGSVRSAFDAFGLDFDEGVARRAVERKKWHHFPLQ